MKQNELQMNKDNKHRKGEKLNISKEIESHNRDIEAYAGQISRESLEFYKWKKA